MAIAERTSSTIGSLAISCKEKKIDACPSTIRGYCHKVEYIVTPRFCRGCKGEYWRRKEEMAKAKADFHRKMTAVEKGERVKEPIEIVHAKAAAISECGKCGKHREGVCPVRPCGITTGMISKCPEGKWSIRDLIKKYLEIVKKTGHTGE